MGLSPIKDSLLYSRPSVNFIGKTKTSPDSYWSVGVAVLFPCEQISNQSDSPDDQSDRQKQIHCDTVLNFSWSFGCLFGHKSSIPHNLFNNNSGSIETCPVGIELCRRPCHSSDYRIVQHERGGIIGRTVHANDRARMLPFPG